jgi:hypothetical protein
MTKHAYRGLLAMGVVLAGKYEGDILEALDRHTVPIRLERSCPNKAILAGREDYMGMPVTLTVSYEGRTEAPQNILVSVLMMGVHDERALSGFLDGLLASTGIQELPSERVQFEKEPLAGWRLVLGPEVSQK